MRYDILDIIVYMLIFWWYFLEDINWSAYKFLIQIKKRNEKRSYQNMNSGSLDKSNIPTSRRLDDEICVVCLYLWELRFFESITCFFCRFLAYSLYFSERVKVWFSMAEDMQPFSSLNMKSVSKAYFCPFLDKNEEKSHAD